MPIVHNIIFLDDNESIFSYGSGSVRSGARSPRKRVKLWHPSQDTVSPFLNESEERSMRRKLNSTSAMDNSTQTPEKNREQPTLISNETTCVQTEDTQNTESVNVENMPIANQKDGDGTDCLSMEPERRALNFETTPKKSSPVEILEPQPSTSAGANDNMNTDKIIKPRRFRSRSQGNSPEAINNSRSSLDSSNDDHVFLRPKNYCPNEADARAKTFQSRNKKYSFLKSKLRKPRALMAPNLKTAEFLDKDGKSTNKQACQSEEVDITTTPSTFKRPQSTMTSSSDEDFSEIHGKSRRKKKPNKKSSEEEGNSFSSDGSSKSKQQRFYQREEEIKIVDFIVQHQAFGQVGGNTLWKLMEATQILPDRTPQSMKERFRRHILPNLNRYTYLSKKDVENFRNPPKENFATRDTMVANIQQCTSNNNSTETTSGNSVEESNNVVGVENANDDNESVVSAVSHRSIASSVASSRLSRNYNHDEEKAILDFIVKNRRYSEVNGNSLWIVMAEKNIVVNRSWQSMKERYRKYIAPKLENFSNLTSNDISQLNKYLSTVSKNIKNKKK